jgi:UrcA family protein
MKSPILRTLLTSAFGAALVVTGAAVVPATSALAQNTVDEVTVTGHYGPDNAPTTLSLPVSYADLDLSTHEGRDMFKHRLSLTARYLCGKLGEDESNDALTPSCRDAAVRDAMAQARPIIAAYRAGTLGATWTPPYPTAWDTTYPDTPYQ